MEILVVIDLFKVRNLSTFIRNSNSNKQDFCSHQINKIMNQSNNFYLQIIKISMDINDQELYDLMLTNINRNHSILT